MISPLTGRRPAHILRHALRFSLREWRSGELSILIAILLTAIACVTAVAAFSDRLQQAMRLGAAELLAADLQLISSRPIDPKWIGEAQQRGIATAHSLSFRSVLRSEDGFRLAEVKAVSSSYPLRGQLQVSNAPFAQEYATREVPALGTVWLEARLLSQLGRSVGDYVSLGAAQFQVAKVLTYEPDRGGNVFNIAPRLMMNWADVGKTQLVQPGSRVKYRALFAGEAPAVDAMRQVLEKGVGDTVSVVDIDTARPELRTTLKRATHFLGLASLTSVLVAGIGIAISAQRYAARHLDTAAMLRCLGASGRLVIAVYVTEMLIVGMLASLAGGMLGLATQSLLSGLLGDLFLIRLPPPSWWPLWVGWTIGLVTLIGFALPPLTRLKDVPPVRVIHRDRMGLPPRGILAYALALATIGLLLYAQGTDFTLASYMLIGAMVAVGLLAGTALALIKVLGLLRHRSGIIWRFGFANIARRKTSSVMQIVAFGFGMTALLLLTFVRADLLESWERQLPPDTPNFFLINVQPTEREGVRTFLAKLGVSQPELYPMVRARLVAMNQQPVTSDRYRSARAKRLATREFNLSWEESLRADNRVVEGAWWSKGNDSEALFSVEEGLAETLGIRVNDTLTFQIAGRRVQGKVTNLRAVKWDSFKVNFFVLMPPGVLEAAPATYVTSLYLPTHQQRRLNELVQQFPSITIIDVDALLSKVKGITEQASAGVEAVFIFTMLSGVGVLLAAIQATQDERKRETALVRALGAKRSQVLLGLISEFFLLGTLAGIVAAMAATLLGYSLASGLFEIHFRLNPWVWVGGILGGGMGIGIAGLLGTYSVLSQPPHEALRKL